MQGWFCSPQCVLLAAERIESANTAQTVSRVTYTASEPVCAPNARETAIAKAHEENMTANRALVDAVTLLAHEVGWLSQKLKDGENNETKVRKE